MTHITEDQKTTVQQPDRHSYHAPRLFVYGAVRELTMNGLSGSGENTGKDSQPTKRA